MKRLLYFLLFVFAAAGCREVYESPVVSPVTGYLVVDGVINSSNPGTTTITLSRTTKLSSRGIVYETLAKLRLEGTDNSVYTIPEKGNGIYSVDNLSLNSSVKYRLRITAKGKDYLSDYAAVKTNQAIDSISWTRDATGLQLFVNTHDPLGNTRYYQWLYDETWQITSPFTAVLKYKIVAARPANLYSVVYKDSTTFSFDPSIVNCWQGNSSNALLLGSSAKLTQDVINLPLTAIPRGSIKVGVLYSINVKQNSWTKEGYEFLEKMKKNTESTGSIFDAQPSELKGNIKCLADSSEPVIGFFNICPVKEKRLFIYNAQVPQWGYFSGCSEVEIKNNSDSIMTYGIGLAPTNPSVYTPLGGIDKFMAASPECVDCTLRGTNKKPAFWP